MIKTWITKSNHVSWTKDSAASFFENAAESFCYPGPPFLSFKAFEAKISYVFFGQNQAKTQCLCGFCGFSVIIPHSSMRRTIPVAFIFLLLFSTLKCAETPGFMRVFGVLVLWKYKRNFRLSHTMFFPCYMRIKRKKSQKAREFVDYRHFWV